MELGIVLRDERRINLWKRIKRAWHELKSATCHDELMVLHPVEPGAYLLEASVYVSANNALTVYYISSKKQQED